VAEARLALTPSGHVRYTFKTPYRDGTTHVVIEPHLTRCHGVFAPHCRLAASVTPAGRGMGASRPPVAEAEPPTPPHVAMNWARRLKRVFGIEIERCARCGGRLRINASIEEPAVIAKFLAHLERAAVDPHRSEWPLGARAPPGPSRLL
jgi:hypothetical protein